MTQDSASIQTMTRRNETEAPESSVSYCKNCHTPLTGPFCHQCGQPDKSIIRFFGDLIRELLEDIISLDSRAVRTLIALLFRPGFLTKEYLAGRRFYYVPPLRLFLITSLFCIFIIWLLNKTSDQQVISTAEAQVATKESLLSKRDNILQSLTDKPLEQLSESERLAVREKFDTINQALELAGEPRLAIPNELLSETERQAVLSLDDKSSNDQARVSKLPKTSPDPIDANAPLNDPLDEDIGLEIKDDGEVRVHIPFLSPQDNQELQQQLTDKVKKLRDPEELKDFLGDLLELIPKTMLLFVPIFAIIMKLCYPFSRRYYIEHLIHAFHGHAFLFLAIVLSIGLQLADESLSTSEFGAVRIIGHIAGLLDVVLMFWIPVYFFLSLKTLYQQHWLLTFVKWTILGFAYLLLFSMSAILVLILSILYN
jgi:hypothetical protein